MAKSHKRIVWILRIICSNIYNKKVDEPLYFKKAMSWND